MTPESRTRETLRYLGYTLGIVAAGFVALALWAVFSAFLDLFLLVFLIVAAAFFVVLVVASVFFLFISKDK